MTETPQRRPSSMGRRIAAAGLDLVLPRTCAGCGSPGNDWCLRCARRATDAPILLNPRIPLPVAAWAAGRYRGPLRGAILARKEQGRRGLTEPLSEVLTHTLRSLARWGELPDTEHLHLIPAPTRALAARRRGGDPVTAMVTMTAAHLGPRVHPTPMLYTAATTRDSAGLGARDRQHNLRGAIRIRGATAARGSPPSPALSLRGPAVLVDDVLTTGATAAESLRALHGCGVAVAAVVVLAGA